MDPDGVLGLMAALDALGGDFQSAHREIDSAAADGPASLTVDGRRAVANAWRTFMEDRRIVPGAVMYSISASAKGVGDATVVIVTGDEQMAQDLVAASFGVDVVL
ncbi:DUF6507 family protein [Microbacterium sp. NPDC008134]|uniref:DUF6507 family protein n=1 Tax=Microbacterium sp. NPDC008134 TaxID=3364183 RepID=UPI0036E11758